MIKESLLVSLKLVSRYGIKKLSGVHRRTKALKKLDMSRCQLSQNGFYELIPIILKSEHVILQVSISISRDHAQLTLDAGQPDHPVGAEDIFWPAEVNREITFYTSFLCIDLICMKNQPL